MLESENRSLGGIFSLFRLQVFLIWMVLLLKLVLDGSGENLKLAVG